MLTPVTLNILKEDLESCDYRNPLDCPITRALHRAGHLNLRDVGVFIKNSEDKSVIDYSDPFYCELVMKVMRMMGHTDSNRHLEPEDFTVTLMLDL